MTMLLAQLDKAEEVLSPFREATPYAYAIIIGLLAIGGSIIGGLLWYIKKQMERNDFLAAQKDTIYATLTQEKDFLHESKLKIAISSAETIREAISLVTVIHNNVIKLNEGTTERKLFEQKVTDTLTNIGKDINTIFSEIKKQ